MLKNPSEKVCYKDAPPGYVPVVSELLIPEPVVRVMISKSTVHRVNTKCISKGRHLCVEAILYYGEFVAKIKVWSKHANWIGYCARLRSICLGKQVHGLVAKSSPALDREVSSRRFA